VSDDFLSRLREEPRPELVSTLGERLRAIDAARRERAPLRRLVPALAGAAFIAVVAVAFTLEPVRAAAREFLDLFRVKRFAAVPVDPDRIARLQQSGLDLKSLVGGQVEVRVAAEKPVTVNGAEAGALEAGVEPHQPATLPAGFELAEVSVARPGAYRVRLDTAKLEQLAQLVGANEIEIPPSWNGATVDIEMPPVLAMQYRRAGADPAASGTPGTMSEAVAGFVFLQSKNPEVVLPEGVELATLGRLGLRVAGMSAAEAESFARSIDWRATLLVPVPVRGGTFREVDVNGHRGLLVTAQPEPRRSTDAAPRRARHHSVVVWAAEDEVFAVQGPGDGVDVLAMAQSVR
jgi:hypothetical protein